MSGRMWLALVIGVIGILALIAGIVYLTVPLRSLPSFFPGHLAHARHNGKYTHRGEAGIGVGIVLILIGSAVGLLARTRSARSY